ncbi:MAG: methyltransferase domain-containing protein [Treponema sp.]|nr:methyltransferase domain-containing protein [Treponema sp.]MCL2251171.1 methyltransferase domain-containing protein [Treponema sp.]
MKSSVLVVPVCEIKRGGGHLCRCMSLVNDLRALGRDAYLYLPKQESINNEREKSLINFFQSYNFPAEFRLSGEKIEFNDLEFIVLDRYQTSLDEILYWKKFAPIIGIDEGGSYRDRFDFLIDILIPEKMGKPHANISSPSLLKFPLNTRFKNTKIKEGYNSQKSMKILITFGQEDPAGLGLKTARFLSGISEKNYLDITLLRGALIKYSDQETIEKLNNVKIIESIPNLAEHLYKYDIVITHYGLTAYEALYAGSAILLASPSHYHSKLSKAAGFIEINFNKKNAFLNQNTAIFSYIKDYYKELAINLNLYYGTGLCDLINSFNLEVHRRCPVCGFESNKTKSTVLISMFGDRTYRRCTKCGIIYMDRTCKPSIEYEKDYFFESYKKQYGKTYLDDFENIKNAAKKRIKIIKDILESIAHTHQEEILSLLDIGCAYGPFLAAAKEDGFSPTGIDPAEDAVHFVNKILGIKAIHSFFPVPSSPFTAPFDVITLWYVIEHFNDCVQIFEEIKKLLKPNGILAFSTPSFSGISARSNMNNFLSASPPDHRTVWSPGMCKKALSAAGFKVKKIVITGHHPERFPLFGKLAKNKNGFVYHILFTISKLFKLGDTFEVYAVFKTLSS